MHSIIKKEELTKEITKLVIEAPLIAHKAQAGQFVALVTDEFAERIPLTLADWDSEKGTITLIFQKIGRSTKKLGSLSTQDFIAHILGPLGHPTEIQNYGNVICLAGGVGIAEILPVAAGLRKEGNSVTSIIGAREKGLLILKDEMEKASSRLLIATDDGSLGHKGFVTDILDEELKKENYKIIFCVGPILMMRKASAIAKGHNVKIKVSLNSNMVDATGMCGTCRIHVGGKTFFTCVDGPEFDGDLVDFDELMIRDKRFSDEEHASFEKFKIIHKCVNKAQKKE